MNEENITYRLDELLAVLENTNKRLGTIGYYLEKIAETMEANNVPVYEVKENKNGQSK